MKTVVFVTSQTILQCIEYFHSTKFHRSIRLKCMLSHTFLVLITVELDHGVYRNLYTLIGGQRTEKFENLWVIVTLIWTKPSFSVKIKQSNVGCPIA